MIKKEKEIIELDYTFTESDGKYIISELKSFYLKFLLNFYEFGDEFSEKQIFLIDEYCWIFREYADYLDAKYFTKNERDYLDNLQNPELMPIFRILELRFNIWFKYHKLIDSDSIYSHYNPVDSYHVIEFKQMIIGSFYCESLPGSKRDLLKFSRESIAVLTGVKKESETEVYKNGGGSPPDEIRFILFKLHQSNNSTHHKDFKIWKRIEHDFDRSIERGPYAKYYQHLAKGPEIKLPKSGPKPTHQEHCPNCSTLMVIISHHDTYRQHTDYLKCPKCGTKTKKFR